VEATVELLRRLAAGDEPSLRVILSERHDQPGALDRVTRALVQLSALLAADAGTTSLRWAVDRASSVGVDDAALVQVLLSSAYATGFAQTVASAPRLALALDVDIEIEGWDGN
jgi:alkylhydroperoxidase family enzyme